jgi:hypothetical protein
MSLVTDLLVLWMLSKLISEILGLGISDYEDYGLLGCGK